MALPAAMVPIAIGAGIGAMTSDDPLKGAAIGGALGGVGGMAFGSGGALAQSTAPAYGAISAPAGSQAAMLASQTAGLVPSQAQMLAAQTSEFGVPGLLGTAEAAATAPNANMATRAMGAAGNIFSGDKSNELMQAGSAISSMGGRQQPPPPMPVMGQAPMINPNAGGQFRSPYDNPMAFNVSRPSVLPGFRR